MSLARRLKQLVDRLLPRVAVVRRARRSRRGSHRDVIRKGHAELNRRLAEAIGTKVASGPFAGMVLTPMTFREHVAPSLLGIYEAELHPWIERLLQREFPQVIDVGAKFGYYAVGLSRAMPGARSVAFDVDPWARRATREVAKANGVTTLKVLDFATPGWFDQHLLPGALVISDCEGFERELFPPITTRAADRCTFVIEVHEAMAPGATRRIVDRFERTHHIERVPTQRDAIEPAPLRARLGMFSDAELVVLADELRGSDQEWLVLVPR
jgi:hypothetical protein